MMRALFPPSVILNLFQDPFLRTHGAIRSQHSLAARSLAPVMMYRLSFTFSIFVACNAAADGPPGA